MLNRQASDTLSDMGKATQQTTEVPSSTAAQRDDTEYFDRDELRDLAEASTKRWKGLLDRLAK